MTRIQSLQYSLYEARRTLRDRLRRHLDRHERSRPSIENSAPQLTDPQVLDLLLAVDVSIGLSPAEARRLYETERDRRPAARTFDAVLDSGWFVAVWGRLHQHRDLGTAVEESDEDTRACVEAVQKQIYQKRWSLRASPLDLRARQAAITAAADPPDRVPRSSNPVWVATRLWEASAVHAAPEDRLRFWFDRWELLDTPWFVPSEHWSRRDLQDFETAVFAALEDEPAIHGWSEERVRVAAALAVGSRISLDETLQHVREPGTTYMERDRWLDRPDVERGWRESLFDARGDLSALIMLLLEDAASTEHGPAPTPSVKRLADFARERPLILFDIVMAVRKHPELLADLLLYAPTAPLAVSLVARASPPHYAWDAKLRDDDGRVARLASFEDSIEVLVHHVSLGEVEAGELAALLEWFEERAAKVHWQTGEPVLDARMVAWIDREIARWGESLNNEIVARLINDRTPTLGEPRFVAILHIVAVGRAKLVDPVRIVRAYIDTIRTLDHEPSTVRFQPREAVALASLARASGGDVFPQFLRPIDFRGEARKIDPAADDAFDREQSLTLRLRTHIRVLARAATGWKGEPPPDLVDALVELIHAGAEANLSKGLLAAFASRHETSRGRNERSIAVDLADLLRALPRKQARLLDAIAKIDEPLVLAGVLDASPPEARAPLRDRISKLQPEDAGRTWSLTEIWARINALLDAGLDDAAETYLAVEREAKTLGAVSGREVFRFRSELRLRLHRRQFDAILNAVAPPLKSDEEEEARRTLEHYQALAQMSLGGADLERSIEHFRHLHERAPHDSNAAVNYFAGLVQSVLKRAELKPAGSSERPSMSVIQIIGKADPDLFDEVQEIVSRGDAMMEVLDSPSEEERSGFAFNKAQILMTIGDFEEAITTLRNIPERSREEEEVLIVLAFALARAGRESEAASVLARAEGLHGNTPRVREARAKLQGEGLAMRIATTEGPDRVTRLKEALAEFQMLPPNEKATVWLQSTEAPLHRLLSDFIQRAGRQVMSLVPTMRTLEMDGDEDRITALLESHLKLVLSVLGWHASRALKGFTPKGNPGHCDLVVTAGDASDLTVIEAVVCRLDPATNEFMRKDLTEHFIRLFGYASSRTLVHLTYSFRPTPIEVVRALEFYAKNVEGTRLVHTSNEMLPDDADGPRGFVATYTLDGEICRVVFLVLDVQQSHQRMAAAQSGAMKARGQPAAKKAGERAERRNDQVPEPGTTKKKGRPGRAKKGNQSGGPSTTSGK